MTVKEAVELFSDQMKNEIYSYIPSDELQSVMIAAVDEVARSVLDTDKAQQ